MNALVTSSGRVLREPRHVIATLRLLVLAGLAMLGVGSPPANTFLYWFVTVVYGVTIFGYLWARNRDYDLRRVKWAVFLFDVAMISLLIVARGQQPTEFLTAYFGLVLMAAVIEGLGNAIMNAVFVSMVYAVLTRWGEPFEAMLTFPVISHFVFFFIVAVFMGHLAAEARARDADRDQVRAQLKAKSGELKQSTSQLREARDALRASDRLATLGMLSAGIAHEMKNPLAAIVGNLEPALEIVEDLQGCHELKNGARADLAELGSVFDDLQLSAEQLQRVARDLTSMAHQGPSAATAVAPAESLESVRRMLAKSASRGVEIHTSVDTDRSILTDQGRLFQILLNLGSNALDAMQEQEEGTLTFRAESGPPDRVVLTVEDTGPGMPDEVKQRMFEPFFTTKPAGRGTGLGLHLVNEIVRAQGGTLSCRTELGTGTTFRIELPADLARENTEIENHGNFACNAPDRGRRGDDSPRAEAHVAAGAV